MRILANSSFDCGTEIRAMEDYGKDLPPDQYVIVEKDSGALGGDGFAVHVHFQTGPIEEAGVNGCQNEDLIAICIDRLLSFQKGPFACTENESALQKLREASYWLNKRTLDRQERGVEGQNKP